MEFANKKAVMDSTWKRACPRCGETGVNVPLEQVIDSLAISTEGRVGPSELFLDTPLEWAACTGRACSVAWFSEDGHEVGRDQLRAHDLHVLRFFRIPSAPAPSRERAVHDGGTT